MQCFSWWRILFHPHALADATHPLGCDDFKETLFLNSEFYILHQLLSLIKEMVNVTLQHIRELLKVVLNLVPMSTYKFNHSIACSFDYLFWNIKLHYLIRFLTSVWLDVIFVRDDTVNFQNFILYSKKNFQTSHFQKCPGKSFSSSQISSLMHADKVSNSI